MAPLVRACHCACVVATALGCCASACSQDLDRTDRVQRAGAPFVGVEVGKPHYGTSCGNIAGLSCSNNGTSVSVTAGDMFTHNWGAELSYLDLGKADRAGGTVSARGMNFSIVGRLPVTDALDVAGKLGTTWGITHVNAGPTSGLENGHSKGFGVGYGAALDLHFPRGLVGSIGWERHEFHFIGQGTSPVNNLTLGLAYRF